MQLPKKLKILSVPYQIEYVDERSRMDTNETVRAQIYYDKQLLQILKTEKTTPEIIWNCIFHEVFHALEYGVGINFGAKDDEEKEKKIEALAGAINCFLWENGILKKDTPKRNKNEPKKKN